MLSEISGNTYRVLLDNDRFPEEIDKIRTDSALRKLREKVHALNETIEKVKRLDPDLLQMIAEMLRENGSSMLDDNWELTNFESTIEDVQEQLTNNDVVPLKEDMMTLEDIGFIEDYSSRKTRWERMLEDSDEQEVVEEIIIVDNDIHFRKRTIIWEKTDYGRASKNIIYQPLRLDVSMHKLIYNTLRSKKDD